MTTTFRSTDGRWLVMAAGWDTRRQATVLWVLRDQQLVAVCHSIAEVARHVPLHLLAEHTEQP